MKFAVFDCETTGLWDFKKPTEHAKQPYPVETAVRLYDEKENMLEDIVVYTVPPLPISSDAAKIHGITNERIRKIGLPMDEGLAEIHRVIQQADILVGFNVDFDTKILASAMLRTTGKKMFDPTRQMFYCVMKKLTPVLKIPRGRGYKWPTLTQAVDRILHKDHSDAHAASADVEVTAELFIKMMQTRDLHTLVA